MNQLMQYVGIIIILIGVVILGLYYINVFNSNGILITAAVVMVGGLIAQIFLTRKSLDE